MGYGIRDGNIQTFTPDDDANTLYIAADWDSIGLDYLMNRIHDHFGEDANLENFSIASEHIHTDCLGYNRYDRGDYTNYIVITRNES